MFVTSKVACRTGPAPKHWQISVTISIHKIGDEKKCTNYGGILLISVPGKIYAKCREIDKLKLTDAQCGFFFLAEAQRTRSLPCSKSLRSRGNMRKRSIHVLLILKKHMIAFLDTSFGRCCCSMVLPYWWPVTNCY